MSVNSVPVLRLMGKSAAPPTAGAAPRGRGTARGRGEIFCIPFSFYVYYMAQEMVGVLALLCSPLQVAAAVMRLYSRALRMRQNPDLDEDGKFTGVRAGMTGELLLYNIYILCVSKDCPHSALPGTGRLHLKLTLYGQKFMDTRPVHLCELPRLLLFINHGC